MIDLKILKFNSYFTIQKKHKIFLKNFSNTYVSPRYDQVVQTSHLVLCLLI